MNHVHRNGLKCTYLHKLIVTNNYLYISNNATTKKKNLKIHTRTHKIYNCK